MAQVSAGAHCKEVDFFTKRTQFRLRLQQIAEKSIASVRLRGPRGKRCRD
jgi:hypothetical protein